MRHLITLLLVLAIAGLSAQSWGNRKKVKGDGNMVNKDRSVREFSGVSVCCSMKVELRRGNHAVRVAAESNLQEYIRTEVVGGHLEIGFKSNVNIQSMKPITVYVTLPEVEYLGASSSSHIVGKDAFTGEDLEIDASSSGTIEIEFSGDRVDADASSSGKIMLAGQGNRIKADASSGAKIKAGDYAVKRARTGASSGGRVVVKVSEDLEADASSGGRVSYYGSPQSVDSDTSSGGRVSKQ